ncbi:hypothetical protein Tco_0587165, partial [Tanacetum coccineum]
MLTSLRADTDGESYRTEPPELLKKESESLW